MKTNNPTPKGGSRAGQVLMTAYSTRFQNGDLVKTDCGRTGKVIFDRNGAVEVQLHQGDRAMETPRRLVYSHKRLTAIEPDELNTTSFYGRTA